MNSIEVTLKMFGHTPKWWQNFINDLRNDLQIDGKLISGNDIRKAILIYDADYISWNITLGSAKIIFNDPKKYTWFLIRWSE